MIEEADEPDYEPLVWTLFEATAGSCRSIKHMESSPQPPQTDAIHSRDAPQTHAALSADSIPKGSTTIGRQIYQKRSGVMIKMQKESAFAIGSLPTKRLMMYQSISASRSIQRGSMGRMGFFWTTSVRNTSMPR
jgi:hypothetical protein